MTSSRLFSSSKALFLVMSLSLLLAACSITTDITLNSDGSAHIRTPYVMTPGTVSRAQLYASQDSFFRSSQISELSWTTDSLHMEYNIKTIDSAGNYLYTGFNKDYFRLKFSNDTLTLKESDGPALKNKHDYDCCTFTISITSERKIKSIQANRSNVKQKGNTVYIIQKGRHFRKGKKKLDVMIVYE